MNDLNNLNQLGSDFSKKLEDAIRAELSNALTKRTGDPNTNVSLENKLSELPEQMAKSLAPIFNFIATVTGPKLNAKRKQQLVNKINEQKKG